MDEFKQTFELFDHKGTGTIKSEQVAEALRQLGCTVQATQVKELLEAKAASGAKVIDFACFIAILAEVKNEHTEA